MKKLMFVFSVLTALAVVAAPAPAPKKVNPVKASQEAWWALKKSTDALISKNFKGGFANYWHNDIDAALKKLEEELQKDIYLPREKIEICRQIARCHLEATRDVNAAIAAVEYPIKNLNLQGADRDLAAAKLAEVKRITSVEPVANPTAKTAPKKDEAYFSALFAKAKAPHGYGYGLAADYAKFCNATYGKDMFAKLDKMLDDNLKLNPNSDALFAVFNNLAVTWNPQGYTATVKGRKELIEFFIKRTDKRRPTSQQLFSYAANYDYLASYTYKFAKEFIANPITVKDPHAQKRIDNALVQAKRFVAIVDAVEDYSDADDIAEDYLESIGKKGDKVEYAKFLSDVAKQLNKKHNEKALRKVLAMREKVVPARKQVKTECFWWADAPRDVKSVVDSPVYAKAKKGLLNLKYGDNLKFLIETDAALTGREMTVDDGAKFRPTEFFAYADGEGVRMILRLFLDNINDVKNGFAGVPGFESYVATGIDSPYHCLMFAPKEGGNMDASFLTQYDNFTGHRANRNNIRIDTVYLDDGVASLITFPWELVFASIPSDKTPAWYVEFINWMKGGYSLGGSTTVHSRSSFAEMKFTGFDKAAMAVIKRKLLIKGRNIFNASCSPRENGYIEKWSDPELGDQKFYLAKVKPLVDSITPYLKKIKPTMTEDEVLETYDAVGEKMLNINFIVENMRREWLDDVFTAE